MPDSLHPDDGWTTATSPEPLPVHVLAQVAADSKEALDPSNFPQTEPSYDGWDKS